MVSNHQGYRAFHRGRDPQSNTTERKRTKNGSLEMVEVDSPLLVWKNESEGGYADRSLADDLDKSPRNQTEKRHG